MPELGSSGSVRGARGNPRSYRDKCSGRTSGRQFDRDALGSRFRSAAANGAGAPTQMDASH